MQVLLINGSPHENGTTAAALQIVAKTLSAHHIDSSIIWLGNRPVSDCIACGACATQHRCVFNDDPVNAILAQAATADAFVFGSPVYYAHPSGRLLSALDRLFYAGKANFTHKPAAAIAVARRAGTTATLDVINKYFAMNQMPIVGSTYWSQAYGRTAADLTQDHEGVQTLQNLAHNLAWLLQCLDAGRARGILPPQSNR